MAQLLVYDKNKQLIFETTMIKSYSIKETPRGIKRE